MGRTVRSLAAALGAALTLSIFVPSPASARDDDGSDGLIVLTGRAFVGEGERYDDVVIFHGPAVVAGSVDDRVLALNGDVTVSGEVGGDVVALNGDIVLEDGGFVGGDARARGQIQVAPGATVEGERGGLRRGDLSFDRAFAASFAAWLAVGVSTLVLGLLLLWLAPRGADAIADAARWRAGSRIGIGLLVFFGLPLLAILALLTLVGIPLGFGLLLALFLLYSVGYVTSAWLLGRRLVGAPRPRWIAYVAGWAILRGVALVPVLNMIVWLGAAIFGLGALAVAAWRARRELPPAPPAPAPAL